MKCCLLVGEVHGEIGDTRNDRPRHGKVSHEKYEFFSASGDGASVIMIPQGCATDTHGEVYDFSITG